MKKNAGALYSPDLQSSMSLNNHHKDSKEARGSLVSRFKAILKTGFPYVLEPVGKGIPLSAENSGMRPVLLAISGGLDSMVLGSLLHEAGLPAIWIHCNFELRGAESSRDEAFVRQQADLLQVPLIVQSFETKQKATAWKMSIEETARKLRYDFFKSLLLRDFSYLKEPDHTEGYAVNAVGRRQLPKLLPPRFLMTAHHSGDQIETLLLNLFRGTGMTGLGGMRPRNDYILRPLLSVKRADLLSYALSN